jgi:DNA polymerase-3 subunit gamma/tau
MKGDTAGALGQLAEMYRAGAEPGVVVQDLLELTHWLTRLKMLPTLADDPAVPEAERARGKAMATKLSVAVLARTWQMLLKGIAETQAAPSPLSALEMLIVRLTYAAELPTPAELVAGAPAPSAPVSSSSNGGGGAGGARATTMAAGSPVRASAAPGGQAQAMRRAEPEMAAANDLAPVVPGVPDPQTFAEVVALFETKREGILHAHLMNAVHLVHFEPGRIEFRTNESAPRDLATRVMELLGVWTTKRWMVAISREAGQPTLAQQASAKLQAQKAAAATHPLVRAVLDAFPGSAIETVRGVDAAAPSADAPAAAEAELYTDNEDEEPS